MSKSQIIWLVILLLLLALSVAALVVYQKIRRKIMDFSEAAFGTADLAQGLKMQADELSEQPRSVSAMTRLMEPQIMRDFPDFSWLKFKAEAENTLTSALLAIAEASTNGLHGASEAIKEQVSGIIADNRAAGVKEVYRNIRIHQTEIANYTKSHGKCVITVQSALEFYHYKEKEGSLTEGEMERKTQTKYNLLLVYIQDADEAGGNAIGTICPNCGAPVKNLGNMVCEYCGSAITPINNKVWSFEKFEEVDYHHVS